AIIALGLAAAFLYLLFQVIIISILPCLASLAAMLLAQYAYCRHKIGILKKAQGVNLSKICFDNKAKQWDWQPDDTQIALYADEGMSKLLSLLAGAVTAWIFLSRLHANGTFNRQVWWFLWHSSGVSPKASLTIASLLIGFAVIAVLFAFNSFSMFRRFLMRNGDSFVSLEDRVNLDQANALFKAAMQLYTEAKNENKTDVSIAMELEQIFQALNSENLSLLVQNRKWQEFRAIMDGIIADLQRLKRNANAGWQGANFWQNETEEEKAYRILGVPLNASDSEIREAFRRLAMIHHPDRGGNSETMKEISWAYEILKKKKQFI
ncbi:MAG: DnaJ domain-containing protein, partial [Bacteroidota bacterium]